MTTFVTATTVNPNIGSGTTAIHLAGCSHLGKANVHVGSTYEATSAKALNAAIHAKYADEPAYRIASCAKDVATSHYQVPATRNDITCSCGREFTTLVGLTRHCDAAYRKMRVSYFDSITITKGA